jgi:Caspase domain/WD domain, G-beta repeat
MPLQSKFAATAGQLMARVCVVLAMSAQSNAGAQALRLYVESGINHSARSVAFSHDGKFVAAGGLDRTIRVWSRAPNRELLTLPINAMSHSIAFHPSRRVLASADENGELTVWNLETQKLIVSLRPCSNVSSGTSVAFSTNGSTLFCTDDLAGVIRRWSVDGFEELAAKRINTNGHLHNCQLNIDGTILAGIDESGRMRIFYTETWAEIYEMTQGPYSINRVAFAPKSNRLATSAEIADRIEIWGGNDDRSRAYRHGAFKTHIAHSLAFSADEQVIAYASESGDVVLVDADRWEELQRLRSFSNRVEDVGVLGDSNVLAVHLWYDKMIKWDLKVGVPNFEDTERGILAESSPAKGDVFDQRITVSNEKDSVQFLNESKKEIATIVLLDKENSWITVAPDGRFDTNKDLDGVSGVHWVLSGSVFDPLPLEIYLRDYYEPRLLPRILAGEKLPELPSLVGLNRAQPLVEIIAIDRKAADLSPESTDTVSVTVEVSGASGEFGQNEHKRMMQTGAYDLRLYRDGQLIKQYPAELDESSEPGKTREEELTKWRATREVVDAKSGKKRITFSGIELPRRAGVKEVEFSAYAFNVDRVKSETARKKFPIPPNLSPRLGKAYILTVGVNAFQNKRLDLSYAANDAREMGTTLKSRLQAVIQSATQKPYQDDVVWVPLITDSKKDAAGNVLRDTAGNAILSVNDATKDKIKAVLEVLAGKTVDKQRLRGVPAAEQLTRAHPEDLIIIALSTHGDVDNRGRFYLLPHDIGSGDESNKAMLKHAISSEELSAWIREIDAQDMVMIVDACHSAASVKTKDFKPGPMGDRGLGQLAYDKGMRILAATQVDQYALETDQTKQGLLTYALVEDGLKQGKANFKPADDNQILLSEWLSYGAERVPSLYKEWRECQDKAANNGTGECKLKAKTATPLDALPQNLISLQQPALFDFARKRDIVIGRSRE